METFHFCKHFADCAEALRWVWQLLFTALLSRSTLIFWDVGPCLSTLLTSSFCCWEYRQVLIQLADPASVWWLNDIAVLFSIYGSLNLIFNGLRFGSKSREVCFNLLMHNRTWKMILMFSVILTVLLFRLHCFDFSHVYYRPQKFQLTYWSNPYKLLLASNFDIS